jgi:hypothetical protein
MNFLLKPNSLKNQQLARVVEEKFLAFVLKCKKHVDQLRPLDIKVLWMYKSA